MKKEPCAVKLGRKGGKVSTRKKKGIHSPAFKKKRRAVAKKKAAKKKVAKKKAAKKKTK